MKTKQIQVYKIDELSDKAKEKAIEKVKDSMIENNFEDFNFFAKDELKFGYGLNAILKYDLGYSQGDGLRFVTDDLATTQIIEKLKLDQDMIELIKILTESDDIRVSVNDNGEFWRYAYSHSRQVDIEFSEDVEKRFPEHTRKAIHQAFIDVYINICRDLEKQGYNCYDVSEKQVIEYANENEYEYLTNGDIFYE
jgi:hypothetical protein